MPDRAARRAQDREIVRLAVPAFLALVAEPLYLLSDAAIIGHLGVEPLAGLGIAGAVLQTVVGVCVFLAYGTTASVARRLGAGDRAGALGEGIHGLWLAVLIGVLVTVVVAGLPGSWVGLFGPGPEVAEQATAYLRVAALGIGPLLVMLAATGVLRGLQDTTTPLVVAVAGNLANIALNLLLVHGLDLGIAGSALGSVLAQVASAVALTAVVVRAARRESTSLRPDPAGILEVARAGVPLVVRTLTLRAVLLLTAYAVTRGATGDQQAVDVATHQLAMTIWTLLAFVLDAIAIAAQAITGRLLGAGDTDGARAATRRMVWWGVVSGVVTGALVAAAAPLVGGLFVDDERVVDLLVPVLVVVAVTQPLAGIAFVLDGVLIGAGDGRFLARAMLVAGLLTAPLVLLLAGSGLVAIWVAFSGFFMLARAAVLVWRARGDTWLVTGRSLPA
jgi:putative MATE family efflux protein